MRTVFHLSSPDPRDQHHALANARNLVDDDSVSAPGDDVAVVANGPGVRAFVAATVADRGVVGELTERGVSLLACRNSHRGQEATADDLLPGVETVPSGTGALARLQDEGCGYIEAP